MGCEAPWWCAVGASVGSCKIGPPVAQRIAATLDHERARKARRTMGRCMGEDAGEGWGDKVGGVGRRAGNGAT